MIKTNCVGLTAVMVLRSTGGAWRYWIFLAALLIWQCATARAQETLGESASAQAMPAQSPPTVGAETAPPNSSSNAQGLTDELLDMLSAPPKGAEKNLSLKPADVGLDGEDLSEQSSDPLQAVRQSMLIAAGFIDQGQTNLQTQQLQGDIIKRLDEMIDQLAQPARQSDQQPQTKPQAGQSTNPQSQSQQQREADQERGGQFATSARSKSQSVPKDGAKQKSSQSNTGEPEGIDLKNANSPAGQIQLADPRAMQQKVWGQLPERVREKMQSRMVEQFLPSYREQIEAYYRELAKSNYRDQ